MNYLDRFSHLSEPTRDTVDTVARYYERQARPELPFEDTDELVGILRTIRQSLSCRALAAELSPEGQAELRDAFASFRPEYRTLPPACAEECPERVSEVIANLIQDFGLGLACWRLMADQDDPSEDIHEDDLPNHECFRYGDLVEIRARQSGHSGHALNGRVGTFIDYTDPRLGHAERMARVLLPGDPPDLVLVNLLDLDFHPEEDFYVERFERLGTWGQDGFRLELYDTHAVDRLGKSILAYEFYDAEFGTVPVFRGADFHCSPLHSIDSDATASSLLSFLSLRPGDTDAEHFLEYTPQQLEWCEQRGEELDCVVEMLRQCHEWKELHERGQTEEVILAIARQGVPEDVWKVLHTDMFEAYDLVAALSSDDEHSDDEDLRKLSDDLLYLQSEGLYREGMREAEHSLGDDARDYDRILHGLCHVLTSRGLALTPFDLADFFHFPLASYATSFPLETVIRGMDEALREDDPKPTYDQQQVLSSGIAPYVGLQSIDDLIDEKELRAYRRTVQAALDQSEQQRGTLRNRLATVRRDVERIRRQAEIVEALAGRETGGSSGRRAFARKLEEAADRLEQRARHEVERIDERLERLPIERAESLRPIRNLRLKKGAFEGNLAHPDAAYIADHSMLIRKEAITRRDRAERLASRRHPMVKDDGLLLTAEKCERTFRAAVERVRQEAVLLGCFEYVRRAQWKPYKILSTSIAVAVTSEDELVYLAADLVRFINSVVGGFDSLTVLIREAGPAARNPQRRAAYDPAVFFKGGEPVAVLMPLNYSMDELPFDVATARERLGLPAAQQGQAAAQEPASVKSAEQEALVDAWIGFGNDVPWMHLASPPFGRDSFTFCRNVEELIGHLLALERHDVGAAYVLGDVCVINLNNDPGSHEEWLVIKGRTVIGNLPLRVRDEYWELDREATAGKVREAVELLGRTTEEECGEEVFRKRL